jgi:hypothetical protein
MVSSEMLNCKPLSTQAADIMHLTLHDVMEITNGQPFQNSSQSPYFYTFMEPRNRLLGMNSASLCSLAGRYDNPIPPQFLAPIDCLKIPALNSVFSSGAKCHYQVAEFLLHKCKRMSFKYINK